MSLTVLVLKICGFQRLEVRLICHFRTKIKDPEFLAGNTPLIKLSLSSMFSSINKLKILTSSLDIDGFFPEEYGMFALFFPPSKYGQERDKDGHEVKVDEAYRNGRIITKINHSW